MTKSNPNWTPPINGWQYELIPDPCDATPVVLADEFVIWTTNAGLFCFSLPPLVVGHETALKGRGSLEFCCRILDAALRGGK